jgi:carboxypeptidase C (cathepsin A)
MSTTPSAAPSADASRTSDERSAVEALVQRAPVLSTGHVRLHDGRELAYDTRCAFLPVLRGGAGDAASQVDAAVFTIAYLQQGARAAERPVCFAFNGGPGSSSIWLHLGALGPKRMVVPDDGTMPEPPFAVSDNPLTWLEHMDLVFVDPPHTGWSRCASDEARQRMFSVDGDVEALCEVIRGWLAAHRRFGSPLYVAGESYGTTRAAAISERLMGLGIALSGVVLASCAMDIQSVFHSPRNDLPFATFLPALAAVAQYHGCLKGSLQASPQAARLAAEAFVQREYLAALHAGARLEPSARRRVARELSALTGLGVDAVEGHNLRISERDFFMELLRNRGLQIGRLDARSTAPLGARQGRAALFDPGIDAIMAPFASAAMAYMAEGLGVQETARYEILSDIAHKAWNWNRGEARGNGFCSTSDDLSRALRRNPHLRVLVASGRYDLGTPYSATDWSLAQLDVPPSVLARVEHRYYDAGHMMYTRQADLQAMHADLSAWLARQPATGG